jgi:hypothetical protein
MIRQSMKLALRKRETLFLSDFFLFCCFGIIVLKMLREFHDNTDIFGQISLVSLLVFIFAWVIYFLRIKRGYKLDIFTASLSSILIALLFFTINQFVLVNVDRSRSFYVIAWAKEGKLCYDEKKLVLKDIKSFEVLNTYAIDQRVSEQVHRGILSRTTPSNCLKTTQVGNIYFAVAESVSSFFNLQGWRTNKT